MDHSPKLKAKIIKLFPQNTEVNLYDWRSVVSQI